MTSIAFRRSLKLTADALQLMRTGSVHALLLCPPRLPV